MMQDRKLQELVKGALSARENAYVPYSHYSVGAALLAGEEIIYGCNIENASYGATNCAERTAFFKAVSEGKRDFRAIAIAGGLEGQAPIEYAYPCGICRQVMKEFVGDGFKVIVVKSLEDYKIYDFIDILPFGFGGDAIK